MYSKRGRRRLLKAYLLGASTVLAVELAVVGAILVPRTVAVAGSPQPVAAPQQTAQQEPPPPPSPEPEPVPATEPTPATTTAAPAAKPTTTQAPAPPARDEPVASGQRPGTIRLPDGGTATLVRREVGPDAVLPVPDNVDEATWWGAGLDAPSGASLFAGHVNWNGRTGPFAELWDIGIDEAVTVSDDGGTVWTYRVTQIVTVHKDELPARAADLFSQGGRHRIVLVTCGGRWLGGNTGYADNRVVIAEPA
ncbi:class F sortase [Saccharomonospora sp. NPDC046836]|uniref:class F sortase n=1 Tax=Saccharomonospora sp. NPDC046836 TaxID=3156921 RepID=UPI0033C13068